MFWDIFLPILIFLFSAAATVAAWFGKQADNRKRNLQKIMPKGWWVISFTCAGLITTGITAYYNSSSQAKLNATILKTKENSDSTLIADKAIKSMLNTISIQSDSNGRLFIHQLLTSTEKVIEENKINNFIVPNVTPNTGPLMVKERQSQKIALMLSFCNNTSSPIDDFNTSVISITLSNGVYRKSNKVTQLFRPSITIPPNRCYGGEFTITNISDTIYFVYKAHYIFQGGSYSMKQNFSVAYLNKSQMYIYSYQTDSKLFAYLKSEHLLK